jgi:aspartate/methionine/tyrosine aminotransferase
MKALIENQTHYAAFSGMLPLREALAQKLTERTRFRPRPTGDCDGGR